ncbi:MAG: hypothetical protein ACI8XO_004306 [Verrucomicrobiales bacterium]
MKVADAWEANDMPNYESDFTLVAGPRSKLRPVGVQQAAAAAKGEVIYSENFDKDPGYVGVKGANDNNVSSVAFGGGNAGFPKVQLGQYAGTSQYRAGTFVVGSTDKGAFAIGSDREVQGKSRNRSYVTFIDTSAASVGQYNVSFDVSDFKTKYKNTKLYLHLYEGQAEAGHVKIQVTSQKILPELASTRPIVTTSLGGINYHVLLDNEIERNGKFSLNFGLTKVGAPGNYLALVWSQVKHKGNGAMPSMTIDKVSVSKLAVPDKVISAAVIPPAPVGQVGK